MRHSFEVYGVRTLAWGLAICSAILTGIFTASFGGDSWVLVPICFIVGTLLSAMCPVMFNFAARAVAEMNFWRVAIAVPFALLFGFSDIVTNGGTSAMFRQSEMTLADNQNDKAKNARSEVMRIESRIADIRADTAWTGTYRAAGAYDKLIESGEAYVRMEAARGGCKTKCEARMRELDSLRAERTNASRREALKAETVTLERELKAAKVASAETPTRASSATTHATNLAAGISGQINPDDKEKFWANYKLSALFGISVTLACIAASIISGLVSGAAGRSQSERYVTNRIISDDRPEADAEALHAVSIINKQPPAQRREDFLKQLSAIMDDIDNTVGRRAA